MKKSAILFIILLATAAIWADEYKIIRMNSSLIKIGNKACRPGDVFSDKSIIYWKGDKQAFKAQNLTTKEIHLFAAPAFQNNGSRTIKEYYVKKNLLSTRAGLFSLEDLEAQIGDTIYLWEKAKIESPYQLDSTSYFYLSYKDNEGKSIQSILESDKDSIVIDKSAFRNRFSGNGVFVSLHYKNVRMKEDHPVKKSIFVYFIPDKY